MGFYSYVFVVQKLLRKFWPILNLGRLQKVQDLIFSVKALLPPNCYMASLDLKDAYLHIPIAQSCPETPKTSDLKIKEETFHLRFQALPFGFSSSPRIFTCDGGSPGNTPAQRHFYYCLSRWLASLWNHPRKVGQGSEIHTQDFLRKLGWLVKCNLISHPADYILGIRPRLGTSKGVVFYSKEKIYKIQWRCCRTVTKAQ